MNGSIFDGDRRGVTPVVGIVLLIAITIMLASTVAAFALGLGESEQRETAPTVAFGFDYDASASGDDELDVTHRSGNTVDSTNLYVVVGGATCDGSTNDPNGRYRADAFSGAPTDVSAGVTLRVDGSPPPIDCGPGDLDLSSATVRLVWDTGTGASTTYRTWHGPG